MPRKAKRISKRALTRLWNIISDLEEWQARADVDPKLAALVSPPKRELIDLYRNLEHKAEES